MLCRRLSTCQIGLALLTECPNKSTTDCVFPGAGHKGIFHLPLFLAEDTNVAGPLLEESYQPPWPVSARVKDGWSRKAAMPDCLEKQSASRVSARMLGMHP